MLAALLIAFQLAGAQQATLGYPPVLVAFSNADFSLPCETLPFIPHATYNLALIRGKDPGTLVCAGYWTPDNVTLYPLSSDPTHCEARSFTSATSFHLANLGVHHTDYYTCQMEIFRPPPYRTLTSREMYLYVHDEALPKCESVPLSIYWVSIGLGVALFTCTIVIISLCLKKMPRKSAPALPDPSSEYMPMAAVAAAKNNGFEKRLNIPKWGPESVDSKCNGVPGTHIHNKFYDSA